MKDYLVAALEDPFVGTSQKGKDFWKKMHGNARLFIPDPFFCEPSYSNFKDAIF